MEKKTWFASILVCVATIAIILEIIGFSVQGWLCCTFQKSQQQNEGLDSSFWSDVMSSWNNIGELDYDILTESTPDPLKRQKRFRLSNTVSDPSEHKSMKDSEHTTRVPRPGRPWSRATMPTVTGKPPDLEQQEKIYAEFRTWAHENMDLENMLPKNQDFIKWLGTERNNLFLVRQIMGKFLESKEQDGEDGTTYALVFQLWIDKVRALARAERPWMDITVNLSRQDEIYEEFRIWLERANGSNEAIPPVYRMFLIWLNNNTNGLLNLKPFIDRFVMSKRKSFSTLQEAEREMAMQEYIATVESWFKREFDSQKTKAVVMDAELKWKVTLGLWSGKGCLISGGEEIDCDKTEAGHLEDYNLVVGGKATWSNMRVMTVIGLCFGVIGLVATVLTVKPINIRGCKRIMTAVGICGLTVSCVLFLVSITQVTGIMSDLEKNHNSPYDEPVETATPPGAVISGTGASLALISAALLAFYAWVEERNKWSRFDDNSAIMFKNEDETPNGIKVEGKDQIRI